MEDTKTKKQLHRLATWVIAGAAMAWAGSIALHAAQTQCPAEAPGDRPAPRDDNRPDGPPPGQVSRGQDNDRPRGDRPPPGPPPLQRAIDGLDLTAEQHEKVDPILSSFRQKQQQAREEFLKQMKETLTADQYATIESAMRPPAPPQREGRDDPDGRPGNPPEPPRRNRNAENENGPQASTPKADPALGVPVTLTGGFETDPRDHGRPVVLIAAALNVSSEIFRDAFSHVTPASGGREPEPAQVNLNKQALLQNLGPHGVTNDRLDTVSNYYRYNGSKGQMWRHIPAVVYAKVNNGMVTGFTIADAGAGYSSPPKVSIAGMDNVTATAILSYGSDFAKNGSIKDIKLRP